MHAGAYSIQITKQFKLCQYQWKAILFHLAKVTCYNMVFSLQSCQKFHVNFLRLMKQVLNYYNSDYVVCFSTTLIFRPNNMHITIHSILFAVEYLMNVWNNCACPWKRAHTHMQHTYILYHMHTHNYIIIYQGLYIILQDNV